MPAHASVPRSEPLVSKVGIIKFARLIGAGVAGGATGGFIAGGIGSRVAMRLVALLAGKEMYGVQTEAGEIVGQITLSGSAFLCVASAIGSIPFGIALALTRGLFPGKAAIRHGLFYGLVLLAIFGSLVIEGDNFDFRIFVSPWLAVLLFAALFPLFGLVAATVIDRIAGPPKESSSPLLLLAFWMPVSVAMLIGMQKNVEALQQIFR